MAQQYSFEPVDHDPFDGQDPGAPAIAFAQELTEQDKQAAAEALAQTHQAGPQPPKLSDRETALVAAGMAPAQAVYSALGAGLGTLRDIAGGGLQGDVSRAFGPQAAGASQEDKAAAAGKALQAAGSLVPGGLEAKPEGSLGIFGGKLSATADKDALGAAQHSYYSGDAPGVTWQDHGWYKDVDGKWKYEIPDNKAKLHPDATPANLDPGNEYPLGMALQHPAFFAAYPEAKDWGLGYGASGSHKGFFQDNGPGVSPTIQLNPNLSRDEQLSTLLHEAQHGVQGIEGFARGAAPATLQPSELEYTKSLIPEYNRLKALPNPTLEDAQKFDQIHSLLSQVDQFNQLAYNRYRNSAGEVEARNVQARADFGSSDSRAFHPDTTADVRPGQRSVNFQVEGGPMAQNVSSSPYGVEMTPQELQQHEAHLAEVRQQFPSLLDHPGTPSIDFIRGQEAKTKELELQNFKDVYGEDGENMRRMSNAYANTYDDSRAASLRSQMDELDAKHNTGVVQEARLSARGYPDEALPDFWKELRQTHDNTMGASLEDLPEELRAQMRRLPSGQDFDKMNFEQKASFFGVSKALERMMNEGGMTEKQALEKAFQAGGRRDGADSAELFQRDYQNYLNLRGQPPSETLPQRLAPPKSLLPASQSIPQAPKPLLPSGWHPDAAQGLQQEHDFLAQHHGPDSDVLARIADALERKPQQLPELSDPARGAVAAAQQTHEALAPQPLSDLHEQMVQQLQDSRREVTRDGETFWEAPEPEVGYTRGQAYDLRNHGYHLVEDHSASPTTRSWVWSKELPDRPPPADPMDQVGLDNPQQQVQQGLQQPGMKTSPESRLASSKAAFPSPDPDFHGHFTHALALADMHAPEFLKQMFGRHYGPTGMHLGNGMIDLSANLGPKSNTTGYIQRTLDLPAKSVEHEYFELADEKQGQGLAKKLLGNQVGLYQKMGLDKVNLFANINVGGYAWGKYGFAPRQAAWDKLRKDLGGESSLLRQLPEEAHEELQSHLASEDPKSLWHISDMKTPVETEEYGQLPLGKALLLDRNWHGSLDLNDPEAMERFNAYIKQSKAAGK